MDVGTIIKDLNEVTVEVASLNKNVEIVENEVVQLEMLHPWLHLKLI